jgi:hypothetical protein
VSLALLVTQALLEILALLVRPVQLVILEQLALQALLAQLVTKDLLLRQNRQQTQTYYG